MYKTNTLTAQKWIVKVQRVLVILLLLFFVALALFPFVYMVVVSLIQDGMSMKLTWDYLSNATWTFENYGRVIYTGNFVRYMFNSAIVALISCVVTCLTSSLAAYGFTKKKFPGSNFAYMLYLLTMMIPSTVILIPLYLMIKNMGLLNSYIGIAVPYAASAFGTILMCSFMKSIPNELLESADIDGASELRKFITIILPLIKPALISLTIFTFVSCWGSFLWPLISTTKNDMQVVTVAVSRLKNDRVATNYGYVMAGSTLAFLPPFILYIFLQKQFVEGIALSGIKG